MITFYKEKDLVEFGKYLLSEERKSNVFESHEIIKKDGGNPLSIEEMEKEMYDADLKNWLASR